MFEFIHGDLYAICVEQKYFLCGFVLEVFCLFWRYFVCFVCDSVRVWVGGWGSRGEVKSWDGWCWGGGGIVWMFV